MSKSSHGPLRPRAPHTFDPAQGAEGTVNAVEEQVLVRAILADAHGEAERMLAEARASIAARTVTLAQREAQIESELSERAEAEAQRITTRAAGNATVEVRRIALELEREVVRTVMVRTRERLAALVGTAPYREILRAWIEEGARAIGARAVGAGAHSVDKPAAGTKRADAVGEGGLGAPAVRVACTEAERAEVERLLPEVADRLRAEGFNVLLELDPARLPPTEQGVVVTDAAGRRAYANRVSDRMRRLDERVRVLVSQSLLKDNIDG